MVGYVFMLVFLYILLVWIEYILLRRWNVHKMVSPQFYHDPIVDSGIVPTNESIYDRSIVFTGLARNVGKKIQERIQNCVVIGSMFSSYKVIIFENDSNDNTRTLVKNISHSNPNILLIDCKGYDDCKFNQCDLYEYGIMNKNRIDRMTFFRNVYMTIIHNSFSSYDYLCVLDFDIDGIIPLNGIIHALNCPFDWSCICANGRSSVPGTFGMMTTMYDAMAYCSSEKDIQEAKSNTRGMSHLFQKYLKLMWLSQLQTTKDKTGFVPVLSAFNGLALYRMKDIHNLYYQEGYSCEHISLHEQLLRSNKHIWIDLHLILFAGHQGPRNIADFFKY